jgi:hypothetical protein
MVPGRGHFDLYGTPPAAIAAKDGLFARIAREMRRAFDEADPDGGASAQPGE